MYIWVAIDVNEQLIEIREKAKRYLKEHDLSSPTFTLPFHISLKISFHIPDEKFDNVISDIRDFYKTQNPFYIKVKEIEQAGSIVWITMKESVKLAYIHRMLDEMLFEKYGVMQHTFDKDFRFHTSVLMINNEEQITKAFSEIKAAHLPETLIAEKFIIGSSVEGRVGTYSVIEEIQL